MRMRTVVEMSRRRLAPHPQHDAMLDVEQNLLLFSVVSDEGMQGVAVGHPSNQARVGGQRDHSVALDAGEVGTNRFWTYCQNPQCLNCVERLSVCLCVYLRFLRKDAGSLASSVLTRPNSCMTLSSCLRSSWPFSRNMNSWPLLPAGGATKHNFHLNFNKL